MADKNQTTSARRGSDGMALETELSRGSSPKRNARVVNFETQIKGSTARKAEEPKAAVAQSGVN